MTVRLAEEWHGGGLHVASVDHGLRGDAGARDVAAVGALAARLGLPFHPLRVDIGPAEAPGSIEARARAARYAALGDLAVRIGAHGIAVGHTLDDLAETVWLRLVRGAGPRGLVGMWTARPLAPGSPIMLWRPLLGERRAVLREWLRARGIAWSEDATNEDRRFARNRARLEALPALARVLGTDPVPLLVRISRAARALDAAADRLLPVPAPWSEVAALRRNPRGLRRAALARAYADAGGDPGLFTRRHLARALRVVAGRAAAASLPRGLELRRRGPVLRVRTAPPAR